MTITYIALIADVAASRALPAPARGNEQQRRRSADNVADGAAQQMRHQPGTGKAPSTLADHGTAATTAR